MTRRKDDKSMLRISRHDWQNCREISAFGIAKVTANKKRTGYRPVLIREEAFQELQRLRKQQTGNKRLELADLATGAVMLVCGSAELRVDALAMGRSILGKRYALEAQDWLKDSESHPAEPVICANDVAVSDASEASPGSLDRNRDPEDMGRSVQPSKSEA